MSSAFHHGEEAVDGYVLNHGRVNKITTPSFDGGPVALTLVKEEKGHKYYVGHEKEGGKDVDYVMVDGNKHYLEQPYTITTPSGFIDFSITKNDFIAKP